MLQRFRQHQYREELSSPPLASGSLPGRAWPPVAKLLRGLGQGPRGGGLVGRRSAQRLSLIHI
eukprot:1696861-Pyramimonas_sp.AAC.1